MLSERCQAQDHLLSESIEGKWRVTDNEYGVWDNENIQN